MQVLASGLAVAAVALFAPASALAAERWAWPVRGEILTHYRNGDDPYASGQHRGIDIGAPVGTAVNAATAGSVTFAGSAGSAGLTVSMHTADGRFVLSHLHLSELSVKQGDQLAAGDRVGSVGVSGRRSDPRPHLHFGVRDAAGEHAYLDPLGFLPPLGAVPGDVPRGTPLPLAAPARPVRAPAPLAAPRPSDAPARRPTPRSAPRPLAARRRRPAGRPSAVRRPSPARPPLPVRRPTTAPLPSATPRGASRPLERPLPALGARPRRSPERRPAGAREPARAPAHGAPTAASAGSGAAPPASAGALAPPRDATARASGPDLGWVLACVGVGLAALLLAWPGAVRSARALARTAVDTLRRPLFGAR